MLVEQGFHDVFSFLTLKARGHLASVRHLEGGEPAVCPLAGVVGATSSNVSTQGAIDVLCYSSPGDVEGGQDLEGGK